MHQIHQIDFIDIINRRTKYKGTVHNSPYNNRVNTMKNNIKLFKILVYVQVDVGKVVPDA